MKNSKIQFVSLLKEQLLKLPAIVTRLEKREYDFVQALINWLNETEEFLLKNNISDTSRLSGFRSLILSIKYDSNVKSYKKAQMKLASESLLEIQDIIQAILKPVEAKIDENRELVRQILTILSQSKAIKYDQKIGFEAFVNLIWHSLLSNDQLKAGGVKLKSNLNISDIYLLIAEEVDINDFK